MKVLTDYLKNLFLDSLELVLVAVLDTEQLIDPW